MQSCTALLLALTATQVAATGQRPGCSVQAWGNCHAADACCASTEHTCFRQNDYYSQCLTTCPPSGWECSPTTPSPTTAAPVTTPSPTTGAPVTTATPTTAAPTGTPQPSSGTPTTAAPTGANGCSIPEWGDCTQGGCCAAAGTTCFTQNDHYSQCLKVCPEGWECAVEGPTRQPATGAPSTGAPTTVAPTTKSPTVDPTTAAPTTKAPTPEPTTATPTTAAPTGANGCTTPMWGNCQATSCCAHENATCFVHNAHYAQCREDCPAGWDCSVKTPVPAPVQGCSVPKWGECTTSASCCVTVGWSCQQSGTSSYFQCRENQGSLAAKREGNNSEGSKVPLAAIIGGAVAAVLACVAGALVISRRRSTAAPENTAALYKAQAHDV